MNIEDIVTVIGSIGFPIVACGAMAWFYAAQLKDFQSLVAKNNVLTEELLTLLRKDGDEKNQRDLD